MRLADCCQTTDWGPSMTAAATSSPRLAGRQWRKIASGFASAISCSVTWNGAERLRAHVTLALLAHRGPDVGVDGVCAGDGLGGIVDDGEVGSRAPSEASRIREDPRVGRELGRTGDREVEAGEGGHLEQRVGDVVATVADEREPAPGDVAEHLLDREQVGQRLARMVLVGERVHNGHRRPARQLVDRLLRERADDDRRDVARQRASRVGDRLAAAEL